jgi:SAM-dependent methyltransferase
MMTPSQVQTAAALRHVFINAGFTADGVLGLLGAPAYAALSRDEFVPARRLLEHRRGLLVDLVRLFVIDDALDVGGLSEGFPLEELRSLDLIEGVDQIHAVVDVRPYGEPDTDWYVVSDHSAGRGVQSRDEVSPDHVLGVGGASLTLARITPRREVERALDIGTGCGVQALHLSRHVRDVIATDNNPRALQCAQLSAALSGYRWELREGSFLDPVEGETFDLIVSNPPFVISPGRRYTYRDAGLPADELGRQLVSRIPDFLRPGGVAVLLANWLHTQDQDWRDRVSDWVRGTGCSAWIAQREVQDPAEYVGLWLRDAGHAGPDQDRRYREWLEALESWGTTAIGFGWIVLTTSESPWVQVEDVAAARRLPDGAEVSAAVEAFTALDHLDAVSMLTCVPDLSPGVVLQAQSVRLGSGEWVEGPATLGAPGGWRQDELLDSVTHALIDRCDGRRTVDHIIAETSQALDQDPDDVLAVALFRLRELYARGLLSLETHG